MRLTKVNSEDLSVYVDGIMIEMVGVEREVGRVAQAYWEHTTLVVKILPLRKENIATQQITEVKNGKAQTVRVNTVLKAVIKDQKKALFWTISRDRDILAALFPPPTKAK